MKAEEKMNVALMKATSEIEEMAYCIEESRSAFQLAIAADADGEELGSVVCLSLRDLGHVSERLREQVKLLQRLNGVGGTDD